MSVTFLFVQKKKVAGLFQQQKIESPAKQVSVWPLDQSSGPGVDISATCFFSASRESSTCDDPAVGWGGGWPCYVRNYQEAILLLLMVQPEIRETNQLTS